MEPERLALFIPTFFLVSVSPGLCMTLAMTLGMRVGLRRTFWMMGGEVLGVSLVALAALAGVAALMLAQPALFTVLKLLGAGYLLWIGIEALRSRGQLAAVPADATRPEISARELWLQGFITAVANPKGWAFCVALLPPFIDPARALTAQISVMILIIALTELLCMSAYAVGGASLKRLLMRGNQVQWMNRISGSLMIAVAVWLAVS